MIVISAPFGNYFRFHNCLRTLGTFTLHRRRGRLWRVLRTLRPAPGGWVNKLGLPNPGISSLTAEARDCLVSIHGFDSREWLDLVDRSWACDLEFNLSCPNVSSRPDIKQVEPAILRALGIRRRVVCKLPPHRWMDWVRPLWSMGVQHFHCCNTIKTPRGGLSGKALMPYSLWACSEIREAYPDAVLIGGGGVTHPEDVTSYLEAGANDVAVGSALLNPLTWLRVGGMVEAA